MSQKFIDEVLNYHRIQESPTAIKVVNFILNNLGNNLDDVVKNYIDSEMPQRNLSIFVTRYDRMIGLLISQENNKTIIELSKNSLIKMIKEKNIPSDKGLKIFNDREENRYEWMYKILNVSGLKEVDKIKESLKFIDCLTEFYTGESLFEKNLDVASLHSIKTFEDLKIRFEAQKTESLPIIEKLQKEQNTEPSQIMEMLEDLQKYTDEERLINTMIQQGYLQCDLR